MDFTLKKYRELISSLVKDGYSFQTFEEFIKKPNEKVVLLRHDVDLLPQNSLRFAQIQNEYGIRGSYYFRMVPESWDEDIVMQVASLGHEIGYHYETMDTSCIKLKREKRDFDHNTLVDTAYGEFESNLEYIRNLVPVKTICMHGSPRSPYDNKEIWKKYDYRELDIIAEPYFDIDFNDVFYLTDTGRRWDGHKVSVRDKVKSRFKYSFHTTDEIIMAVKGSELPPRIMMTFHPQRWHDEVHLWYKELIMQNVKNVIKRLIYVK
jgi:hypothetical protein